MLNFRILCPGILGGLSAAATHACGEEPARYVQHRSLEIKKDFQVF